MRSWVLALSVTLALAGCGGNPFLDGSTVEEGDPNTDAGNRFLWDPEKDLTMNSVTYDPATDKLYINNLPFDGPDGAYDRVFAAADPIVGDTVGPLTTYKSRKTTTTGRVQHYAVFVRGTYIEGAAAAGQDWVNYGNSGANVRRLSGGRQAGGEYVYIGNYAGVRKYSNKPALELVRGEVRLLLDINDFDPTKTDGTTLQGDITGRVYNRVRLDPDTGAVGRSLPDVYLLEVSFDPLTGSWEKGEALTVLADGSESREGQYGGIIGGPDGAEIGGFLNVDQVSDVQIVTYEIVTYTLAGTEYTATGINDALVATYQTTIEAGGALPTTVLPATVPGGATVLSTSTGTRTFATPFTTREIGVFVGDQVAP